MQTHRSTRSQVRRSRERRSMIEPLESRQLLSMTPFLVGMPIAGGTTGIHVPVSVDTGTVAGTVDSGGTAVPNALVVLRPVASTTGGTTTTPVLRRLLVARTGADGSFTLKNVPVGSYTATAYKRGYTPDTSASFAVTKGNTTTVPLTLTAIQFGSVSGSVVDSSNNLWRGRSWC